MKIAALLPAALMPITVFAASSLGDPLPGVFRQTNLDAGGWLTGFASHASGRLYARTDVGGVYRSDDHGINWRFISGEMSSSGGLFVQGLAVAEGSANVIFQAVGTSYAATDPSRGVWKSTDGGATWNHVLPGVVFSGNDDLRWQGECLSITPGSGDQEIFAVSRKNGLWRSGMAGAAGTWSKLGGSLFDGLIGHVVHMHPLFPNEIFVGGVRDGSSSALYKGVRGPGGAITWSAVTVNATSTSVTRLARLPSGVMFAAVQDGGQNRFYQSDATGTSWSNISSSVLGGLTSNGPVGMCHVLRDGETIVLGWIGGPTRKSTNGGSSWISLPFTISGDRPVAMLTGEDSPGWSRGSLHQDPLDANRWYLPNGFGPFVSNDAGTRVEYMTTGIGEVVTWKPAWHPIDPNRVYMPVADLIGFISTDGSPTGLAQKNPRRSLPVNFGNVGMTYATKVLLGPVIGNASPKAYFVGGSFFGPNVGRASIVTSSDDGTTWSLVHVAGVTGSGLPSGSEIVSGCAAPDNENDILVAVHDTSNSNSGFYRSTNGGVAFTKASGVPAGGNWGDEFSHFVFMEADPENPALRFAWLNGVGFLVSNDRGVTWASAGHSPSGPSASKLYDWNKWGYLARDPVTSRLWFGGTDGHLGLASSTNNGTNWTYLDTPFSNTGFSEVRAIDAYDGQVLVSGKRFGDAISKIYYSADNGASWNECTKTGFRFPNTTYVALNPHLRGQFWVATNGRSYSRFSPGRFGQWQQDNFDDSVLNVPAISGPASDADGDGQNNAFEYAAGLNPQDSTSKFSQEVLSLESVSPAFGLRIEPRFTNHTYLVETTSDLSSPANWQPLTNFSFHDEGLARVFYDESPLGGKKFYRVKIFRN